MTEVEFKVNERVAEKGSYRVGTVTSANGNWLSIDWDYPRLRHKYGNWKSIEDKSLMHTRFMEHASAYQERQNAYQLQKRATWPKAKSCDHCDSTELRLIERQHQSHCGTPYEYVHQCLKCKRMTRISEDNPNKTGHFWD